jgi:hypothetical protein
MQSIVDMLGGLYRLFNTPPSKTTFKTVPEGYLDGFQ